MRKLTKKQREQIVKKVLDPNYKPDPSFEKFVAPLRRHWEIMDEQIRLFKGL